MSNIFEGAKFGDVFKTKDGRKAIYHYYEYWHYLITDDGGDICCGDDGTDTKNGCDNIVGRWDEPIDEKPIAYCYNCKSTFSYDKKTLDESETMSVKCPTCGTDICLLD